MKGSSPFTGNRVIFEFKICAKLSFRLSDSTTAEFGSGVSMMAALEFKFEKR